MKKQLTRRAALAAIGLAPVGVKAAAQAVVANNLEGRALGIAMGVTSNAPEPPCYEGGAERVTKWLDWFNADKSQSMMANAKSDAAHRLDPDIHMMMIPLPAKIRMQAKRNYERTLKNERSWFDGVIRQYGHVTRYGDF